MTIFCLFVSQIDQLLLKKIILPSLENIYYGVYFKERYADGNSEHFFCASRT